MESAETNRLFSIFPNCFNSRQDGICFLKLDSRVEVRFLLAVAFQGGFGIFSKRNGFSPPVHQVKSISRPVDSARHGPAVSGTPGRNQDAVLHPWSRSRTPIQSSPGLCTEWARPGAAGSTLLKSRSPRSKSKQDLFTSPLCTPHAMGHTGEKQGGGPKPTWLRDRQ